MQTANRKKSITFKPVVCAVDSFYKICVPTTAKYIISLKIGDRIYHNSVNGNIITDCKVHFFTVEQTALDTEKKYTLQVFPFFKSKSEKACYTETFDFTPVEKSDNIGIYHISDTHGLYDESVKAALNCREKIDLLILNGDISSSSMRFSDILKNYSIAYKITKRGNSVYHHTWKS